MRMPQLLFQPSCPAALAALRVPSGVLLAVNLALASCDSSPLTRDRQTGDQPLCGNGVIESGEVCDDGVTLNGSYGNCNLTCSQEGPHCGDGHVDEGNEQCDEGDANGQPGHCKTDCSGLVAECGDGAVDRLIEGQPGTGTEQCDDGPDNGTYGHCTTDCTYPTFPPRTMPVDAKDSWLDAPPTCTAEDWFAKYLRHRLRFRGNGTKQFPGFISRGLGAGESLPMSDRRPTVDCATDYFIQADSCWFDPNATTNTSSSWGEINNGGYYTGDTTIWLGYYIAVLATEYGMLARLGLDTSQTVEDLFLALSAFNRLDLTADTHFNVPGVLDGFFQRSDIPHEFMRREDGSARFLQTDPGLAGFGCMSTPSACGWPVSVDYGYYMSQDQAAGMILGLAFVNKLVPDSLNYGGMSLRHEARAQVHRIVSHLRNNGWFITAPDGSHPPEKWGGEALLLSDQFAKAANQICGTDFDVADYRDAVSSIAGVQGLDGLDVAWPMTLYYTRSMALKLVSVTGEWNAQHLAERCIETSRDPYLLIAAVLHGTDVSAHVSPWRMESLISSAPCDGPCIGTPGCENVLGWRGDDRLFCARYRAGQETGETFEFNGLDFLLLHNLYFLYRDGHYGFGKPTVPDAGCGTFVGLEDIIAAGAASDTTYDPFDPCAAADLGRHFCGRPFSAWLDDAYQGRVTIGTAGLRWSCEGMGPCVLRTGLMDGTDRDDLLIGTDEDDVIDGGAGNDCIYGLGGGDTLIGGLGADEIHGGPGNDQIVGDESFNAATGGPDVLFGDEGNDILAGGPGDNELSGGPGDDQMFGGQNADYMDGNDGNDEMHGGEDNDNMHGGVGDDVMVGDGGDDRVYGGPGRDKLRGGPGGDTLSGGLDDDLIKGDDGDDRLIGMEGIDTLCGDAGADRICGDATGDGWVCHDVDDLCQGGGEAEDSLGGCTQIVDLSACSDDSFAAW